MASGPPRTDGPEDRHGEVVLSGQRWPIQLSLDHNRFEIRIDEQVAFLLFHLRGPKLTLIHTEVPPALRNQGLAGALARAALDYARGQALRVKITCPFVAEYITRHPEFRDLVETGDE